MKLNNRRSYFAPIAEIVIVDNSDDVLGGDFQIQSFKQGGNDDEAGAKGLTFDSLEPELQSDIWDRLE